MDKKEYFEVSYLRSVTPRCPILNVCQRRALSSYFFSFVEQTTGSGTTNWEEVLLRHDQLSEEYYKNKVEIQGESPTISKGSTSMYFSHTCPEMSLFENEHKPSCIGETACITGSWDNERIKEKFRIIEERHYSECPEYSKYIHNMQTIKKISLQKKTRLKIPQENKVRAELQKEINSTCPFCISQEVGHFEIHHIDEDPSNNDRNNLLLLCPTCHSKITKGDISRTDVFKIKLKLITSSMSQPIENRSINTFSKVDTAIVGNHNNVVIKQQKATKQKYPPGCIGYDTSKANYVGHLIKRYNEYKEYELGDVLNYATFNGHLKKQFKIPPTRTIYNLPIEQFELLASYIKGRIDNTKLARVKGKSHRNYSSFEDYVIGSY
jgi:hypothetical protein